MAAENGALAKIIPFPGRPDPAGCPMAQTCSGWAVTVTIDQGTPTILSSVADPGELWRIGAVLQEAARAQRNGDDPAEVARYEWEYRQGRPPDW